MGKTRLPEEISLTALMEGDGPAWDRFIATYDHIVEGVVAWSKWGFKPHDREELAQDIRLELKKAIRHYREEASIEGFLKRVCINRCIDRVRREVRARQTFVSPVVETDSGEVLELEGVADETFNPVHEVVKNERARVVVDELAHVGETCARAIRLFYLEDRSYKEIGEQLGIKVNTVGSRLAKCLEKLRGRIRQNPFLREYLLGPERPSA